ncbi:hypothetical protein Tsubulata_047199 [Turnera subulata]|uniref:Cytochrome c-553 n=1 Tax=Turnera subulata TaxID=218843 RepID=A0A9Q0JJR8_9ROSI|nr:hypothetical protein Tsubulata_047199 [Turnera subulata]
MHIVSAVQPGCSSRPNSISAQGNRKEEVLQRTIPSKQKEVKFLLKSLAPPLVAAIVALSPMICNTPVSLAQSVDIQRGATLFGRTCIGCHDAGGNIIQPVSDLFLSFIHGSVNQIIITLICYFISFPVCISSLIHNCNIPISGSDTFSERPAKVKFDRQKPQSFISLLTIICSAYEMEQIQRKRYIESPTLAREECQIDIFTEFDHFTFSQVFLKRGYNLWVQGFGENCTPRGQCTFGPRLKDEEIKLLAEFVKLQADQGWPSIVTNQE